MNNNAIPIVILHRNEFESLFRMIESITTSTRFPYRLFVVDNASNLPERDTHFSRLRAVPGLTLIESSRNNWVLGFNEALGHPSWPATAPYYVFSDADIVVPGNPPGSACWLQYLVDQMNTHACIGKLGMSLRTNDIDNEILKESVTRQHARFMRNPRIGTNIIAPSTLR